MSACTDLVAAGDACLRCEICNVAVESESELAHVVDGELSRVTNRVHGFEPEFEHVGDGEITRITKKVAELLDSLKTLGDKEVAVIVDEVFGAVKAGYPGKTSESTTPVVDTEPGRKELYKRINVVMEYLRNAYPREFSLASREAKNKSDEKMKRVMSKVKPKHANAFIKKWTTIADYVLVGQSREWVIRDAMAGGISMCRRLITESEDPFSTQSIKNEDLDEIDKWMKAVSHDVDALTKLAKRIDDKFNTKNPTKYSVAVKGVLRRTMRDVLEMAAKDLQSTNAPKP